MARAPASAVPAPPRAFDRAREIEQLDRLARLLDARFGVPGTGFRIGWDSIVGLIPGVGDTLTLVPSAYLVWKAHQLGVPRSTLVRMAANTGIDFAIGSIPVVGDVFDMFFKANLRNVSLLRRHLEPAGPG